jgi:hypothetical protein
MTGSSLAPIVIPIVVAISLAAWIFMVYHADSHPYWRGQATAPEQPRTGVSEAADQRPGLPQRKATSIQQAEDPMARQPQPMDEQKSSHAA